MKKSRKIIRLSISSVIKKETEEKKYNQVIFLPNEQSVYILRSASSIQYCLIVYYYLSRITNCRSVLGTVSIGRLVQVSPNRQPYERSLSSTNCVITWQILVKNSQQLLCFICKCFIPFVLLILVSNKVLEEIR